MVRHPLSVLYQVAEDILKALRRNVPLPITCKVRLLPTRAQTVDFLMLMEGQQRADATRQRVSAFSSPQSE